MLDQGTSVIQSLGEILQAYLNRGKHASFGMSKESHVAAIRAEERGRGLSGGGCTAEEPGGNGSSRCFSRESEDCYLLLLISSLHPIYPPSSSRHPIVPISHSSASSSFDSAEPSCGRRHPTLYLSLVNKLFFFSLFLKAPIKLMQKM